MGGCGDHIRGANAAMNVKSPDGQFNALENPRNGTKRLHLLSTWS
jgi:hypothetical protein